MDSLSLQEATENLDNLIDRITANHQPILVQGSHHDAVIVAREDWAAIEETIYLNAIPGYVESIEETITGPRENMETSLPVITIFQISKIARVGRLCLYSLN